VHLAVTLTFIRSNQVVYHKLQALHMDPFDQDYAFPPPLPVDTELTHVVFYGDSRAKMWPDTPGIKQETNMEQREKRRGEGEEWRNGARGGKTQNPFFLKRSTQRPVLEPWNWRSQLQADSAAMGLTREDPPQSPA